MLKIHQRGVQWKQGVVICMMLDTSLLHNATPIHCTPLPLQPPVMNTWIPNTDYHRRALELWLGQLPNSARTKQQDKQTCSIHVVSSMNEHSSWQTEQCKPEHCINAVEQHESKRVSSTSVVVIGRGDDKVGNPHRAQIHQFELFQLVLLLKPDKRFPVERFEAAVSQSTVPPLLSKWHSEERVCTAREWWVFQ